MKQLTREEKIENFINESIWKLRFLPKPILNRILEIKITDAYSDWFGGEKIYLRINYIWIFCKKNIYTTVI